MKAFAKKLLVALVGLPGLTGCSVSATNWNDHIDAESRAQITALDNQIAIAFHNNDPQQLKQVFSDELRQTAGPALDELMAQAHPYFTTPTYSRLDDYMTTSAKVGSVLILTKGDTAADAYQLGYQPATPDTYASLLLTNTPADKALLTCLYGKYDDGWKLNALKIGEYSFFGKSAPDFYQQAKADYEKGRLLDAVADMVMVKRTVRPAGSLFQYYREDEMKAFSEKVLAEANAKLPLPLKVSQLATAPEIFSLTPTVMNEGIFPLIAYRSNIPLNDTTALKKENYKLKAVVGQIFPELSKGKKYVFLRAYNEMPDGKKKVEFYGFSWVTPAQ